MPSQCPQWALLLDANESRPYSGRSGELALQDVGCTKNELLFRGGINYNDLPAWQKRGSGLFWETEIKAGPNPLTGEQAATQRRKLKVELELPMKEPYADFIVALVNHYGG